MVGDLYLCAQTLMAKAAASAAAESNDFCFIKISVGKLFNKYQGVAAAAVEILIDIAVQNQPTVLFVDEIESLIFDRNNTSGNSGSSSTVGTLLEKVSEMEGVFMIAATNVPW